MRFHRAIEQIPRSIKLRALISDHDQVKPSVTFLRLVSRVKESSHRWYMITVWYRSQSKFSSIGDFRQSTHILYDSDQVCYLWYVADRLQLMAFKTTVLTASVTFWRISMYDIWTRIKPGTRKLNLPLPWTWLSIEGLDYQDLKQSLVLYTLVIYSLSLRVGYLTARRVRLRVSPFGLSEL